MDDIDIDDHIYEDGDEDVDNRSQRQSSSLLGNNFEVQKRLFRKKATERRLLEGAYSIGSKVGSLTTHQNVDVKVDEELSESKTQSSSSKCQCLEFLRTVALTSRASESFPYAEDDEADNDSPNKSITVDDDVSIVSDLDSCKIETANVEILEHYRIKSIESILPNTHQPGAHVTHYSLHNEALHDAEAFLDAPTPKVQNNAPGSFATYLEGLYLPSVSIDNAEAGVVRWRHFPNIEMQAKTARKLNFSSHDGDDHQSDQLEESIVPSDAEGIGDNSEFADQGHLMQDPLCAVESSFSEPEKPNRGKIKVRSIDCITILGCLLHELVADCT